MSDEFASGSVVGKSLDSNDITSDQVTLSNGESAYKSSDMLDGEIILVRSPDYLDADGHIKWTDADGFVTDSSGNPITVPAELKTSQVID